MGSHGQEIQGAHVSLAESARSQYAWRGAGMGLGFRARMQQYIPSFRLNLEWCP